MNYRLINLGLWKDESIEVFKKCFRSAGIKFKMDSDYNFYISDADKKLAKKVIKVNKLYLSI